MNILLVYILVIGFGGFVMVGSLSIVLGKQSRQTALSQVLWNRLNQIK